MQPVQYYLPKPQQQIQYHQVPIQYLQQPAQQYPPMPLNQAYPKQVLPSQYRPKQGQAFQSQQTAGASTADHQFQYSNANKQDLNKKDTQQLMKDPQYIQKEAQAQHLSQNQKEEESNLENVVSSSSEAVNNDSNNNKDKHNQLSSSDRSSNLRKIQSFATQQQQVSQQQQQQIIQLQSGQSGRSSHSNNNSSRQNQKNVSFSNDSPVRNISQPDTLIGAGGGGGAYNIQVQNITNDETTLLQQIKKEQFLQSSAERYLQAQQKIKQSQIVQIEADTHSRLLQVIKQKDRELDSMHALQGRLGILERQDQLTRETIDNLNAKCHGMDRENANLNRQLQDKIAEIQHLALMEDKVNQLIDENQKISHFYQEEVERTKCLQKDLQKSNEQQCVSESSRMQLQSVLKELDNKLKGLSQENLELKGDCVEKTNKLAHLVQVSHQVVQLQEDNLNLHAVIQERNGEIDRLNVACQEKARMMDDLQQLQEEVSLQKEKALEIEAGYVALYQENEVLRAQVHEKGLEVVQLTDIQQQQDQCSSLLVNENQKLSGLVKQNIEEAQQWKNKFFDLDSRFLQLQNDEARNAQISIGQLEHKTRQLQQRLEMKSAEADRYQKELQESRATSVELSILRPKVDQIVAENMRLNEQLERIRIEQADSSMWRNKCLQVQQQVLNITDQNQNQAINQLHLQRPQPTHMHTHHQQQQMLNNNNNFNTNVTFQPTLQTESQLTHVHNLQERNNSSPIRQQTIQQTIQQQNSAKMASPRSARSSQANHNNNNISIQNSANKKKDSIVNSRNISPVNSAQKHQHNLSQLQQQQQQQSSSRNQYQYKMIDTSQFMESNEQILNNSRPIAQPTTATVNSNSKQIENANKFSIRLKPVVNQSQSQQQQQQQEHIHQPSYSQQMESQQQQQQLVQKSEVDYWQDKYAQLLSQVQGSNYNGQVSQMQRDQDNSSKLQKSL